MTKSNGFGIETEVYRRTTRSMLTSLRRDSALRALEANFKGQSLRGISVEFDEALGSPSQRPVSQYAGPCRGEEPGNKKSIMKNLHEGGNPWPKLGGIRY